MAKVKKPKVANGRIRYLTPDELERLLAATKLSANPYLQTVVVTVISSGMRYSKTRPDTPVELRKSWETTLRQAKIENFRFHDLRHTTASYLAMDGATAPEIAEVLGQRPADGQMSCYFCLSSLPPGSWF